MNNYSLIRQGAIKAHEGQTYGAKPYSYHLQKVEDVARRFMSCLETSRTDLVLAICWCHDLIEDCRFTYNDVLKLTDEKEIAEAVRAVTSDIRGRNRAERMSEAVYNDIHLTPYAKFVKLCDRIANVEYSLETNSVMFNTYKKEHAHFKDKLKIEIKFDPMWEHLDNLFTYHINEYKLQLTT